MSVINQMLKDLEQRSPEQGQTATPTVADQNPSTLKVVLISVVVLLCLNALGFYIWDLQARAAQNFSQQNLNQLNNSQPLQTQSQQQHQVQQATNIAKQEKFPIQKQILKSSLAVESANTIETKQVMSISEDTAVTLPPENIAQALKPEEAQLEATQPEAIIKPEDVTKIVVVKEALVEAETGEAPAPVNMSVSRRQLTSTELVAQKLARAEKSVNLNEIGKAEQLFEEILIIEPEHKQARKNLAALWFGRKSYQQALNLLSQGIAIDKQDGELRLLKARIHLQQGQHEAAYNTLKPLAAFEHEEYQVMLANIAQQIKQYPSAISAYKVLINMQPYSGRWHLGLAIVYDKNSQFTLARNEYAQALIKADLSVSSAKFAEQRLQALGE